MRCLVILMMVLAWGCDDESAPFDQENKVPGVSTGPATTMPPSMPASSSAPSVPQSQAGSSAAAPESPAGGTAVSSGPIGGQMDGSEIQQDNSAGHQEHTQDDDLGGSEGPMTSGMDQPNELRGGAPAIFGGSPEILGGSEEPMLGGSEEPMNLGGAIAPLGGRPEANEPQEQTAVQCNRISDLNPRWEVCEQTQNQCSGVFTDGAGCQAFCAAAGLVCKARYNGSRGCGLDGRRPIPCLAQNGHRSDWCVCGRPDRRSEDADSQTGPVEESCDD